MSSTGLLAGKCECGTVRYMVADEFLYAANCHCSNCRASTGSAFKPFAGIEREKLEVMQGGDKLLIVGEEDANHTRCAVCGSLLFSVVREGAYIHVAMGSLVDDPGIRPTEHIFVGSKAPWFEITDDLPQNHEY
jgi:hypothetical protein